MIGHDDAREYADIESLTDLIEEVFEVEVIFLSRKDASLAVRAIDHVLHIVTHVGSRWSSHESIRPHKWRFNGGYPHFYVLVLHIKYSNHGGIISAIGSLSTYKKTWPKWGIITPMPSPKTSISLVQGAAVFTCVILAGAALGVTREFGSLRFLTSAGLLILAVQSLSLGYRRIAGTFLLGALLFNPFFHPSLPRHLWVILDIVALLGVAYFAHWATNPYQKGTRFEQYVSTLFPEPDFAVEDRTRDVSKFLNRRVESDSHPDFVFRNQKTGRSFAVECKWRAQWKRGNSGDLGLWWDRAKGENYVAFGRRANMPVYVAFGIGGTPDKPHEVYFLEMERLRYRFLQQSLITSGHKGSLPDSPALGI